MTTLHNPTIQEWVRTATALLRSKGIDSAMLDAELLLSDAICVNRIWLHANSDRVISDELHARSSTMTLAELHEKLMQRANHTPLAYIRGFQEFYGRKFRVTEATLCPRPESEDMITLARNDIEEHPTTALQLIDVGTGSGCLVISAYLEASRINKTTALRAIGLDISHEALEVAKENAATHNTPVQFEPYDILQTKITDYFNDACTMYILANLPYVPSTYPINAAASHEPSIALFGGEDGLNFYRSLFSQCEKKNCTIITESLEFQHAALHEVARHHGFQCTQTLGLQQLFVAI